MWRRYERRLYQLLSNTPMWCDAEQLLSLNSIHLVNGASDMKAWSHFGRWAKSIAGTGQSALHLLSEPCRAGRPASTRGGEMGSALHSHTVVGMLLCYGSKLLVQKDFMYNTRAVCIGLITYRKHAADDGMSGWPWWMYLELASPICNVLHKIRRE